MMLRMRAWPCVAVLTSVTALMISPKLSISSTRRQALVLTARGRLLDELATIDGSNDQEETAAPSAPIEAKERLEPETLFFEGPPSWTELILPAVSILTVVGIIPFVAALSRQVWVRYKITSRRISVQSGLGGNDLSEIIYPDIVGLKYVYRSGGAVGDMVIDLKDGAKLEMRHVPQFRDIYKYILSKISEQARENSDTMRE